MIHTLNHITNVYIENNNNTLESITSQFKKSELYNKEQDYIAIYNCKEDQWEFYTKTPLTYKEFEKATNTELYPKY